MDPQKVEHKCESRGGSGDGVDPQTISSGWMEVEPEMELTPNQLTLNRDGARHGVDPPPPNVRHIWDWNQEWRGPSKGRT